MHGVTLSGLSIFAAALAVAAFSPGPGIAAIVGRVLGRGRAGAFAFTAGIAMGDIVWLSAAVFGLAVLAQSFHGIFLAIRYIGAAYLLFLAYKMWTSPAASFEPKGEVARESRLRLFLGGLSLTLGNPKVMVFYLALLPNLVDLGRVDALAFAELAVVTLSVLAAVFSFYILLALRARRLISSPKAVRLVNRGSGAIMAGAAVAIVTR